MMSNLLRLTIFISLLATSFSLFFQPNRLKNIQKGISILFFRQEKKLYNKFNLSN